MKDARHLPLDLRNLGLTRLIIRISDGNGAQTCTCCHRGGVLGRAHVQGDARVVQPVPWDGKAGQGGVVNPRAEPPAEAAELPRGRADTQTLFSCPFVISKLSFCFPASWLTSEVPGSQLTTFVFT